jgi:NAD+ synthase (glutamine-hydrolysing)
MFRTLAAVKTMKLALAQLNPVVGDIEGNLARLLTTCREWQERADLVVFSELFLTGYPPRDLLAEPWFIEKTQGAIDRLVAASSEFPSLGILFGAPVSAESEAGLGLYNAAILVQGGKRLFTQFKSLLPTYDVFDEARYFDASTEIHTVSFKDTILGINICEDAWNDPSLWTKQMYRTDPVAELARQGAQLLINISASPFYLGKESIRYRLIQNHAQRHGLPFAFVNQVGGNDELIFDGRSMYFDAQGRLTELFPGFEESIRLVDSANPGAPLPFEEQELIASVNEALVLGVHDYLTKCGFHKAVIGLSGGIDSAVVAALAAQAIGKENVMGIAMPSDFSADESLTLARQLAENLGIQFRTIPIKNFYQGYASVLRPELGIKEGEIGLTLENIQARIRGNILMAFSNECKALVLSTGNKSELATGYCTLYGDMAGGLAVISDVPKTMVYDLAHYLNRERELIPERIITRPPTAELRPNQTDQDTLPPYPVLDAILNLYIEEHMPREQIVKRGFDPKIVEWVLKTVNRNEYKRRQAAPGLKVTTRAFGVGRRMPVAARYDS